MYAAFCWLNKGIYMAYTFLQYVGYQIHNARQLIKNNISVDQSRAAFTNMEEL